PAASSRPAPMRAASTGKDDSSPMACRRMRRKTWCAASTPVRSGPCASCSLHESQLSPAPRGLICRNNPGGFAPYTYSYTYAYTCTKRRAIEYAYEYEYVYGGLSVMILRPRINPAGARTPARLPGPGG